MDPGLPIYVDRDNLERFCRRWNVAELSLFGAAVSADFGPGSDVDVLVTFSRDERWSLWDLIMMRDELTVMFGRGGKLVEALALKNPYRRHAILTTAKRLYAT